MAEVRRAAPPWAVARAEVQRASAVSRSPSAWRCMKPTAAAGWLPSRSRLSRSDAGHWVWAAIWFMTRSRWGSERLFAASSRSMMTAASGAATHSLRELSKKPAKAAPQDQFWSPAGSRSQRTLTAFLARSMAQRTHSTRARAAASEVAGARVWPSSAKASLRTIWPRAGLRRMLSRRRGSSSTGVRAMSCGSRAARASPSSSARLMTRSW